MFLGTKTFWWFRALDCNVKETLEKLERPLILIRKIKPKEQKFIVPFRIDWWDLIKKKSITMKHALLIDDKSNLDS